MTRKNSHRGVVDSEGRNARKLALEVEHLNAALQKTNLEIAKLQGELQQSSSRSTLEIDKLRRDLSLGRKAEILLDKWIPSLIGALVLFTMVPLANHWFWRSQKRIDIGISTLARMRDTYSHLSLVSTKFLQIVDRMDELRCTDDGSSDTAINDCGGLRKDRYSVEPTLVGILADVNLYFAPDARAKVTQLMQLYNNLDRKMPDRSFVDSFIAIRRELLHGMRNDLQTREAALLTD